MTAAEQITAGNTSPVNLRQATMDLVRRLSSLPGFVSAANELMTCEHLPLEDIQRHRRKIVTLIEIARDTLCRSGVRLHQLAPCVPVLHRHKVAYFQLLQTLERLRPVMSDDTSLEGRIERLLLSLSANRREPASEDTAAFPCANHHVKPLAPPPLPLARLNTAHGRSAGAESQSKMPPPDTSSPVKRRSNGPLLLDSALRGRQMCRSPLYADLTDEYDSDEDSDESQPVLWKQPPRRFGIFCTPKPGQRRVGGMRR